VFMNRKENGALAVWQLGRGELGLTKGTASSKTCPSALQENSVYVGCF